MEVLLLSVGDTDVITFNPITSTILKCLRLKFLRWMHYLHQPALLNNGLGLFTLLGFHVHIISWFMYQMF
jgi:hypothetical protein